MKFMTHTDTQTDTDTQTHARARTTKGRQIERKEGKNEMKRKEKTRQEKKDGGYRSVILYFNSFHFTAFVWNHEAHAAFELVLYNNSTV